MNEFEKMLAGKIYDPNQPDLAKLRCDAHDFCLDFNLLKDRDPKKIEMLQKMWPNAKDLYLQGPIFFDYGINTSFGEQCYANYNFCVVDCCPVKIGNHVYFGPNVSILTPMHPFLAKERNGYIHEDGYLTDKEYAKPITIEDDVWICGNVTIVGGVTIGHDTVIGAGSVVTRNIPSGVLAFGNPCRVIRKLTEEDSIYLKKELF